MCCVVWIAFPESLSNHSLDSCGIARKIASLVSRFLATAGCDCQSTLRQTFDAAWARLGAGKPVTPATRPRDHTFSQYCPKIAAFGESGRQGRLTVVMR
jgi:hypothetical protein